MMVPSKRLGWAAAIAAVMGMASPLRADDASGNWGRWRGPLGTGVAVGGTPPTEWSETKNIRWKKAVEGFGTSTPIIWGNQVIVVTAVATGKNATPPPEAPEGRSNNRFGSFIPGELYQFKVISHDRATGNILWESVAREEAPHEGHHKDHGFASASPVTDGSTLIVSFGSRGIHGYSMDGKKLWEKQLGRMRTRNSFGEGASPALHKGTVVINWDHEGEDSIFALDAKTGEEKWRKARNEPTTWTTPLILEEAGVTQVVVAGTEQTISYNLADGATLWEGPGLTTNVIPTPVADAERVYVMSGFRGAALHAVQRSARGKVTPGSGIAWSHAKSTPYVPSPLLYDRFLYFFSGNNGVLSCFDSVTGKAHYEAERLPGLFGVYASPVGAGDKVYLLGREGTTLVLSKGPKLEIVATNKLDDQTDASMAVAGSEIFVRGHKHLYCVAAK